MTGNEGRGRAPLGQPWSVDMLADLHAGILDEAAATRLWPQVNADPQARAVIDALEATKADLAGLAGVPVRMPEHLTARIDDALAAEQAGRTGQTSRQSNAPLAPVLDLAAARTRRNKMVGLATGIVTAAAAVVGITVAVSTGDTGQSTGGNLAGSGTGSGAGGNRSTQVPSGAAGQGPLALGSSEELNGSVLHETMRARDYGPLGDQEMRASCLSAHGNVPDESIVGARQVTIHGRKGVLFVITTGGPGQFRLLAVGADCAKGNPATLGDKTVG